MSTNFSTFRYAMNVIGVQVSDTNYVKKKELVNNGSFDVDLLSSYTDNEFVQEQHVKIGLGFIVLSYTIDNDSGEDINVTSKIELLMSDGSKQLWWEMETPVTIKRLSRYILNDVAKIRPDNFLNIIIPPPYSIGMMTVTINGTVSSGRTVNWYYNRGYWNGDENVNGIVVSGNTIFYNLNILWTDEAKQEPITRISAWHRADLV